jgi:hypothetical protein
VRERHEADEARRHDEEADRGLRPAVGTPTTASRVDLAAEVEGLPPMAPPPPPLLRPAEIARRRAEQFDILSALERGELVEIPIVSIEALKAKGTE